MIDFSKMNFEQRLDYLTNLSPDAWEKICRGCGICCLNKVDVNGQVFFTRIACDGLDLKTKQCNCYADRFEKHAGCAQVDVHVVRKRKLLPASCAYSEILFGSSVVQPTLNWCDVKNEKDAKIDSTPKLIKHIVPESIYWGTKR